MNQTKHINFLVLVIPTLIILFVIAFTTFSFAQVDNYADARSKAKLALVGGRVAVGITQLDILARKGDSESAFILGRIFLSPKINGLKRDLEKSEKYFSLAAENCYQNSVRYLVEIFYTRRGSQFFAPFKAKKLSQRCLAKQRTPSQIEVDASENATQKEIDRLRQELATLKVQQKRQKQNISDDTQNPVITILSANTTGKQGVIRGKVSDNVGVAELIIDNDAVAVTETGNFKYSTFVPPVGLTVIVQVTDMAGLSSTKKVSLKRDVDQAPVTITFDRLNPISRLTWQNSDALALIIGVSDYKNTAAKAVFADADAMMFRDYASEKLGIPDTRIKTLVNDGAGESELLLSVKLWLSRSVKQNQSDVYIFFAGHGLASDDGSKMYLLPHDGAPELLDDTAISRERLFADISAANPRSVTVFLDTCYSGTTRGTDMLIASRPIAIRALEQSIPDNFTVMTAAAGDQTAKPLEEAKHGMFSYFLMKGMEGEADANKNNEITAGELHSYVQTNVIQQSSGSQTPELQGDADRVLVSFQ